MTDRQTDGRGKTICLPTLSGGDISSSLYSIKAVTQHNTMQKFVQYKGSNSNQHLQIYATAYPCVTACYLMDIGVALELLVKMG